MDEYAQGKFLKAYHKMIVDSKWFVDRCQKKDMPEEVMRNVLELAHDVLEGDYKENKLVKESITNSVKRGTLNLYLFFFVSLKLIPNEKNTEIMDYVLEDYRSKLGR